MKKKSTNESSRSFAVVYILYITQKNHSCFTFIFILFIFTTVVFIDFIILFDTLFFFVTFGGKITTQNIIRHRRVFIRVVQTIIVKPFIGSIIISIATNKRATLR